MLAKRCRNARSKVDLSDTAKQIKRNLKHLAFQLRSDIICPSSFSGQMSYMIACWKEGLPYGVSASNGSFRLIPLDSDSVLSKVFSHPYRAGAQNILSWIKEHDNTINSEELSIQDVARFQR